MRNKVKLCKLNFKTQINFHIKLEKEESLHRIGKCAETIDLCAEYQIAKLSISQKDNEEHDGKASHILGTSAQCQAQLSHSLVEAHIFEYFDPRNEHHA